MSTINISGASKPAILAALYNASRAQGMGFLSFKAEPMTEAQAAKLLKKSTYFDYLQGRVMKIELGGDKLGTLGYDRDNGEGAAHRAIQHLLKIES
jgi:hypothetical protein